MNLGMIKKFVKPTKKWIEIVQNSSLMDKEWYSATYHVPEEEAARHYVEHGAALRFDPSPEFSSGYYLSKYPDVASSGLPPLVHYELFGKHEKRSITAPSVEEEPSETDRWVELLKASPLMDEQWYAATYHVPEEEAIRHFIEHGNGLRYDPSPRFSTEYYYKMYHDVEMSEIPAVIHYILFGRRESRIAIASKDLRTKLWKGRSKTGASLAAYCPESKWHPRPSVEEFVEKIQDKDYISFDIFDTLLIRQVIKPTDIFRLMEIDLNEPGFADRRELVEQECYRRIGSGTTIRDIYERMWGRHGNVQDWIETEFSYELKFCRANPYMQQVFQELRKLGKPIIIVSDMYWPKEYLARLLTNAGYEGWQHLFVSCEHDVTKYPGLLQELAWETIGKEHSVVHIGDHYDSDVKGSLIAGWDSIWYESCRDKSRIFYDMEHPSVPSSIRSGICSNHLNNGAQSFSKEYEHGFLFGGMIVCGFCEYVDQIARQAEAESVWFLARDMDVVHKIYQDHYHTFESKYVYASRSAMLPLNIQEYPLDFFRRYFKSYSISGQLTIGKVLKESKTEVLRQYLFESGLNEKMSFNETAYQKLYDLYMNHLEDVLESFSNSRAGAKRYFENLLGDQKRICVVDLGWNGTIMVELDRFFKHNFPDVELQFVLFGATDSQVTTDLQSAGILHSYAFSSLHNRGLEVNCSTLRGNTSIMCLEAMFSANSPSLLSYALDSKGESALNFCVMTEPEWMVQDIQRGIRDYAATYRELTGQLNKKLYISPEDAFRPYASISEDYQYLYLIFHHVKEYEDGGIVLGNNKVMSTLGTIMANRDVL